VNRRISTVRAGLTAARDLVASGEFIGPTQDRIKALADAAGVGTFAEYDTGKDVYRNGAIRPRHADTGPLGTGPLGTGPLGTGPLGTTPPDPLLLADIVRLSQQIDELSTSVPGSSAATSTGRAGRSRGADRPLTRDQRA
jgi:hypothetical protein